jgi:GDP-L-fucose synthase
MKTTEKIYIAGHAGLVGSAIVRELERQGYFNLVYRAHGELDLTDQRDTFNYFAETKPDYVFLCAAKVGGIVENRDHQADFLYDNLAIAANVIKASKEYNVKRLLNLGSVCIYPKRTPQPIKEEHLLTSTLEPTNECYAIAKIASLKLCQKYNEQYGTSFMTAMPCNIYGINDRSTHVIPELIRKFHLAKQNRNRQVVLYGTGTARREFLHADDLANVCVRLLQCISACPVIGGMVNVGSGLAVSIKELASLIKEIVGYNGEIIYDHSNPDGAPIRQLDCTRLQTVMIWQPKISLEAGITQTYRWSREQGVL